MDNGESCSRRFIEGDRSAFDEVMEVYRDKLIFFIKSYVGDIDIAEDIAMDTFAQILAAPNRFKAKSSFKTYLYSIARHKSVDWLRRRREIPHDDVGCGGEEVCPWHEIESEERSRMLLAAMDRIPADYKTAVYLTYFEQLDAQQAAKVMGKSKKQLANFLYRGKKALRAELEKEGFCYEEQ